MELVGPTPFWDIWDRELEVENNPSNIKVSAHAFLLANRSACLLHFLPADRKDMNCQRTDRICVRYEP
jgi:hypothetical protein